MTAVRFAPAALDVLERLVEFLRETDPQAAAETAGIILRGLAVLAEHPLIGRPLQARRREMVIFRGRTGYLAQYAFRPSHDEVVVLAVRHQREAGEPD